MDLNDELMDYFKHQSLFSEYLPHNFSITAMNDFDIFSIQPAEKSDNIEPYSFTMSNFSANDKRRLLYLPEVTNYVKLINFMVDKKIIDELCNISMQDSHSFSHILQVYDGEASFIKHEGDYGESGIDEVSTLQENEKDDSSTYTSNIVDKLNRAQGAKGILLLDIANCYKSIYTHYLACIKLGLSEAKEQYKLSKSNQSLVCGDYSKYKKFDDLVRMLNTNESSGMLTGPRVSNYIVEAYLSRIDIDIKQELEANPQIKFTDFVRYVDDYEFFIYDPKDVDMIISLVEGILNKYRLTINDLKTQFLPFPYYVVKNLKHLYEKHTLDKSMTTESLVELFNDYFNLEKDGTKGAIRYLIKSIQDDIEFEDEKLYTTFLFNVLVNDNRSLVKVCQLIIRDIHKLNVTDEHYSLIQRLLVQSIDMQMDLECIWLVFLLKKIGCSELDNNTIEKVINSHNDLAIIVLINEYSLSDEDIGKIIDLADSWILIYQLFLKDKISAETFKNNSLISKNLPFYKTLKRNGFSFYRDE